MYCHTDFVFDFSVYRNLYQESYEMAKIGIGIVSMPLLMLYLDDNNKNAYRPLEFHLTLVNERSKKIYAPYKDENYELFKNEAFYYLEKYKTKCIKNNNVFTLISEECQFEDDKNAIGGYKCSDEGIWKKEKNLCIKVDCKEGYYLDKEKNKCIKDPCLNSSEPSSFLPGQ